MKNIELSHYVVPTTINDKSYLFDMTQKIFLPSDSDEEKLRRHRFLKGQEKDALMKAIFRQPTFLKMLIIPTWACNLRCSHCCVIDHLKEYDISQLNVQSLKNFCERYFQKYQSAKNLSFMFCGGEALLESEKILEIMEVCKISGIRRHFNITTNLAMDLTDSVMKALQGFDIIGISIDGNEYTHNKQRCFVEGGGNPFQKTVQNVKKLMLAGFRDKMKVQSVLKDGEIVSPRDYVKSMIRLGFKVGNIKFGAVHPTRKDRSPTEAYKKLLKDPTIRSQFIYPCCKYQCMQQFALSPTNEIYSDYYVYNLVGNLDDDLDNLEKNVTNEIMNNMPVLHDANCQKCPVIGFCWGGCSQGQVMLGSPSDYCNQAALIEHCKKRDFSPFFRSQNESFN